MTIEENKAIVRRMMKDGWNPNDQATFDDLLAEGFVNHEPGAPTVQTRDELKRFWAEHVRAFPDQHTTIDELIGEGEQVVIRFTHHCTQTGEYQGIPPTGKSITVTGLVLYRLASGKISELWWGYDNLGVLQQLGAIPTPEQAAAAAGSAHP